MERKIHIILMALLDTDDLRDDELAVGERFYAILDLRARDLALFRQVADAHAAARGVLGRDMSVRVINCGEPDRIVTGVNHAKYAALPSSPQAQTKVAAWDALFARASRGGMVGRDAVVAPSAPPSLRGIEDVEAFAQDEQDRPRFTLGASYLHFDGEAFHWQVYVEAPITGVITTGTVALRQLEDLLSPGEA